MADNYLISVIGQLNGAQTVYELHVSSTTAVNCVNRNIFIPVVVVLRAKVASSIKGIPTCGPLGDHIPVCVRSGLNIENSPCPVTFMIFLNMSSECLFKF